MVLRYCIALLISLSAFSLTIDNFEGEYSGISAGPFQVSKGGFSDSSAVGGKRKFTINGLTGGAASRTRIGTNLGYLAHSQDTGASGISRIDWDGTTNPDAFSTTGLGAIDFTQDGSNSIKLDVLKFDYPYSHSVKIKIFVYTNSTSSSVSEVTLNNAISTKTSFLLPYADFTANSSNPADFTKVGAVSLEIWGMDDDIDLSLESIGTNSACVLIPDQNGKVVDECSVCGGDNSSCSDCLGIPHGTTLPGSSCQNGEAGVCAGGTFNASCGCVRNNEPTADTCDGIDNDCDGQIDEDFSQKNTACSIGTGLCSLNGTFICSPSGGIMCSVDPQQPQVDLCESTKGCDGVPNSGLVVDQCGVCGGNNSTCSDCNGVPNGGATVDRCGICAGDGLSCLACTEQNQSNTLVKLDGLAKSQEVVIKQATKLLVSRGGKAYRAYAAKMNAQAFKVADSSWHLVWEQLPQVTKICGNKTFCSSVSNVSVIEKYRSNSELLKKLTQDVLRRLAKIKSLAKTTKNLSTLATKYHAQNITYTNQVPLVQSKCS